MTEVFSYHTFIPVPSSIEMSFLLTVSDGDGLLVPVVVVVTIQDTFHTSELYYTTFTVKSRNQKEGVWVFGSN